MFGRVKCLLFVTLMTLGVSIAQAQATTNTTCTAVKVAHKVGRDCTSNTCSNTSNSRADCASCVDFTIGLPQGSKVVKTHCYTVAYIPEYKHGDLHEIECTKDNAWSIFDEPVVSPTESGVTVSTTFRNRAKGGDRDAKLCVDWK
jgi:hypothetical protein